MRLIAKTSVSSGARSRMRSCSAAFNRGPNRVVVIEVVADIIAAAIAVLVLFVVVVGAIAAAVVVIIILAKRSLNDSPPSSPLARREIFRRLFAAKRYSEWEMTQGKHGIPVISLAASVCDRAHKNCD